MKHLQFVPLLLLFLMPFSLWAQDRDELKEQADEYFESGDYSSAKELYSQLTSFYPKDTYYNYRLGACMLYVDSDKTNPLKYLEYAVSKPDVNAEAYFFMGMGYHYNYRFDDAVGWYKRFESKAGSRDLKKYPVADWIAMAENGSTLLRSLSEPKVFKKARLSDVDYYQAIRFDNEGIRYLKAPVDLQSAKDKREDHEPVMYRNTHLGLIFYSSYGSDADNGLDLYMMRLGSDEPAVRLPDNVNTAYDEGMAFLAANGTDFYFSSKGHNSMGGYDIFRCRFDSNSFTFSEPQNMDWAFNTPSDDWIYAESEEEGKAYLASSRNSNAGKISVYTVAPAPEPVSFAFLTGTFTAPNTKSTRIVVEDADNGNRQVAVVNSDKTTGAYSVRLKAGKNYRFVVEPTGSALVHVGMVTIPPVSGVKTLGQEMSIEVQDEVEKLIIKNDFERDMTDDDRRLLAEQLTRSADLGEEEQAPAYSKNEVMTKLLTLEKDLSDKAIRAKKEAAIALAVANDKNELADQKRAEAEKIKAEVEPSGNLSIDDQRKLDRAKQLEKEAIRHTREASAAYSLFSTLDDVYEETFAAGLETSRLSDQISSGNEVSEEQIQKFEGIQETYDAFEGQDPQERAVNEVRDLTRSKRIIAEEANRDMESTYTSISELENDVKYYRNQAATTKDKALKETFEAEAEALDLEAEKAKTKYAQMQDDVERKVREAAAYQTELSFLEEMLDDELKEKEDAPDYSDGIKSGLALEIQDSQERSSRRMEQEGWTEDYLFGEELATSEGSQGSQESRESGESQESGESRESRESQESEESFGSEESVDSPGSEAADRREPTQTADAQVADELSPSHLQNSYVQDLEDRYFFDYDNALSETDPEKRQEALDQVNAQYIADINTKTEALNASYAEADADGKAQIAEQYAVLDEVRRIKNGQMSERQSESDWAVLSTESLVAETTETETNEEGSANTGELEETGAVENNGQAETGNAASDPNTNPVVGVSSQAGEGTLVATSYGDFDSDELRAMPFYSGDSPYNAQYEEQLASLTSVNNADERSNQERTIRQDWLLNINLERASISYKIDAAGSEATRNILQSKLDKLDVLAAEQEQIINALAPAMAVTTSPVDQEGNEGSSDPTTVDTDTPSSIVSEEPSIDSQTGINSSREPVDEIDRGAVPKRQVSEAVVKYEDQLDNERSELGSLREEKEELETELAGLKKKKDKRAKQTEIDAVNEQIDAVESKIQTTEANLVVLRNAENILRTDPTVKPSDKLQADLSAEDARLAMMAQDLADFENQIGETKKKKDREAMREQLEEDRSEYDRLSAEHQGKKMLLADVIDLENELGQANVAKAVEPVELPRVVVTLDEVQVEDVKSTPEYKTYAAAEVVYGKRIESAELKFKQADELEQEGQAQVKRANEMTVEAQTLTGSDKERLENEADDLKVSGQAKLNEAAALRGEASSIEAAATADLNRAKEGILAIEDEQKRQMVLAYVYYESQESGESQESLESGESLADLTEEVVFEKKDPTTPVYSQSNPIPINPAMPEGLVFKVQVGAFRNPIPQETFRGFAPITGETTASGLTRYTAGLFKQINLANDAKNEIRALGYSDAFVVAYYNGERITIARARALMAGDEASTPAIAETRIQTGTGASRQDGTSVSNNEVVPTDGDERIANLNEEEVRSVNPLTEEVQVVPIDDRPELFYTVQVGVFSKEVRASDLYNISPLNSDVTANGYIRYSTGVYASVEAASRAKDRIVQLGVNDAFVTAYYKGERISVAKARGLAGSMTTAPTTNASTETTTTTAAESGAETEANTTELPEVPSNVVVAQGETYGVRVGPYEGEVPVDQARAILNFSYTGVEFRKEDNKSYYTLGKFVDVEQAQRLKQQLQASGIELVEIINRKE